MNKLNTTDRAKIVSALVEGNSIRSTVRMTGAAKRTVTRLMAELGAACREYQNQVFMNIPCEKMQCDEIWSFCGMKDFYRITATNIDLDHNLIQGIQHKTITTSNPTGIAYLVAMPPPLRDIIARKLRFLKPGSRLFPPKNLQKRFGRIRNAAGLGYVTLQDLRRAAATHLLDNGVDPQTVSQSLGHTSLRMLPSYTPRTLRHHREASEKLVFVDGEK